MQINDSSDVVAPVVTPELVFVAVILCLLLTIFVDSLPCPCISWLLHLSLLLLLYSS